MNYKKYVSSLKKNIVVVRKGLNEGVLLTKLEDFDYEFKKSLATLEGVTGKGSFLRKLIDNISDIDCRIANFYAEGLHSVMKLANEGYSMEKVSKQFKKFISTASNRFICSETVVSIVYDINSKIIVKIGCDYESKKVELNGVDDYISIAIYLLSLLGSLEESNKYYKEWLNSYLSKELDNIYKGIEAEPFIEDVPVALDLNTYLRGTGKKSTCIKPKRVYKDTDSNVICISN